MSLPRSHGNTIVMPAVTATVAAGILAVLTTSVAEHNGTTRIDPTVAHDVVTHRSSVLTGPAHVLTFLGSELVVGIAALALVALVLERRGVRHAMIVVATMGTSVVLTVVVKTLLGRDRPGAIDRLGPVDTSYSFPSGHTLNSAVFLGLLCLVLVPLITRGSTRSLVCVLATLLALGVGASRIYLGYHWTTDVIASWMIATILLAAASVAERLWASRSPQSGNSQVRWATLKS